MNGINNRTPEACTNLAEVRSEIDLIDKAIISLLADRFEYVKEVVKYKENTPDSILANERRNEVIECRSRWAQERGLDPEVIGSIYNSLVDYFIKEEMKIKKMI